MSLTIRMSATPNKPNIDKIIKSNKRLRAAAHSSMNNTTVEIEKSQEKLYELYDFCGEVPMDDSCDY